MKNKGFTLIELMIVIAIIGIIIAMVLPTLIDKQTTEVITQDQEVKEIVIEKEPIQVESQKQNENGFNKL